MLKFTLIAGLLIAVATAVALRSIKAALIAASLLLCTIYPALLTLVIPAVVGAIYHQTFYKE